MEASWLFAIVGGALIGAAATLVWLTFGKIAGIAGICAGLLRGEHDRDFRLAFLAGLVLAGALVPRLLAAPPSASTEWPLPIVVGAGLLVGVGARIANGCTSGHGICGVARSSARSWLATSLFVITAALVRVVAATIGGAS